MKLEKFIAVLKVALAIISIVALFVAVIIIPTSVDLIRILFSALLGHCAILSFWVWIPRIGTTRSEDENVDV